jgi:hypothetical protein
MLRESGFGANVFPLVGCNGALLVKLAFGVRTPTPAAVKEGGPLVLSAKTAPWLRAVLRADGTIIDQGFSFSPYDWADLLQTLRLMVSHRAGLEEGLSEALFRRDGRRRTYFCCLERTGLDGRPCGCGKRLLDQNELKAHIHAQHSAPEGNRRQREIMVHSDEMRRKTLGQQWATTYSRTHGPALDKWAQQQMQQLLPALPSESLTSFSARCKQATALDAVDAATDDDDDDDISLAYERVRMRDPTALTKIICPGRGSCCRHLQCFDLNVHVTEAYRRRAQQAQLGGPDKESPHALTLIICPISACALEINVSQLIRDDFFASVIHAVGSDTSVEFVDVVSKQQHCRRARSSLPYFKTLSQGF